MRETGVGHADATPDVRPAGEASTGRERGPRAHPRGSARCSRSCPITRTARTRTCAKSLLAEIEDTRVAIESRPPRLDRRAPRGRGPDRAGRAAQRGQVVAAPGAVGDPDQDGRLRVHDAAAGAGADAHRRRARAARRDPGADRRRERGSRRRPGAARRAALRRRDRLLRCARQAIRASSRRSSTRWPPPRSRSRRSSRRRAPTRRRRRTSSGCGAALPDLDVAARVGPRRRVARRVPRSGLAPDRPDPDLPAQGRRDGRGAARADAAGDRHRRRRLRSITSSPRRSAARGCGDRRRASTASASVATRASRTATRSRSWPDVAALRRRDLLAPDGHDLAHQVVGEGIVRRELERAPAGEVRLELRARACP